MTPRIDHSRVVQIFQKTNNLPLIKTYLVTVQPSNIKAVNEAYYDLLIEEEDFKSLREAIEKFSNFDTMNLALRLEKHDILQFRRIASYLYALNKRWNLAIALSKKDHQYKDAIEAAHQSKDPVIAEDLMQ